ncbi:MAG: hypothetical protein K5686_10565 [Lachnospiraceae bacterium]|nr:hypothetical protein [Lachnospiraceae bacterium]
MEELYLVMDETDAPYNENEISFSREDDADLARFAANHGLDFKEGSPFNELMQYANE